MRTALAFLAAAALSTSLLACEIQGPPADGSPFGPGHFAEGDGARSNLESVQSACEAYCAIESACDSEADADTCIADCVEPKLTAMAAQPESDTVTDCVDPYMESMACAMNEVCADLAACDQAVDDYLACALTP